MKFYTLLFILACSLQLVAQNKPTNEPIIEKDFLPLKSKNKTDLIPFCKNGKWGFVDKSSRKVVVAPKYSNLKLFNPNMLFGTLNDETSFYVDSAGNVTVGQELPASDIMEDKAIDYEKEFVSSDNGFRGFKLNQQGKLITISDFYDKCCTFEELKIKGKSYLIVAKDKSIGIIDSVGDPLPGFDFVHSSINLNDDANDTKNVWFFVKKKGENWSLQNDQSEIRFNNEILSDGVHRPFTATNFGIGLAVNKSKEQSTSGVFDCYEMKWIVKPQSKMHIAGLGYSSKATLNTSDPLQRSKADCYLIIKEGEQDYYYADLNLKIYYPTK